MPCFCNTFLLSPSRCLTLIVVRIRFLHWLVTYDLGDSNSKSNFSSTGTKTPLSSLKTSSVIDLSGNNREKEFERRFPPDSITAQSSSSRSRSLSSSKATGFQSARSVMDEEKSPDLSRQSGKLSSLVPFSHPRPWVFLHLFSLTARKSWSDLKSRFEVAILRCIVLTLPISPSHWIEPS